MKVVLFCGGLGTRLRDYSDNLPKPLVPIGNRPILWHVMKYYAHFGHKDFVLCLGYKAEKVKEYFLNYNECFSNDFVMSEGGKTVALVSSDIQDWRITFVDTGLASNVGQRLRYVENYLDGDEYFLANYSDGLTDADLNVMIGAFQVTGKVAGFACASPSQTFHVVTLKEDGTVAKIEHVRDSGTLVNAGYFIFHKRIFDYIEPGDELVDKPFKKLIAENQLVGYRCNRFWAMDTFKEQQELTDAYNSGNAPWELWRRRR